MKEHIISWNIHKNNNFQESRQKRDNIFNKLKEAERLNKKGCLVILRNSDEITMDNYQNFTFTPDYTACGLANNFNLRDGLLEFEFNNKAPFSDQIPLLSALELYTVAQKLYVFSVCYPGYWLIELANNTEILSNI